MGNCSMNDTVELRVAPTALQVGDTALVNRAGAPAMVAMGTAVSANADDFATASQGGRADTALQPGAQIPWSDVTGKPVLFDGTWASLTGKPATYAPAPHGHTIGDVTGLQGALDAAAASGPVSSVGGATGAVQLRTINGQPLVGSGNIVIEGGEGGGEPIGTVAWADVTDKPATFPPAPHSHAIADVTGLQGALDGKAAALHTHTIAQISDFPVLAPVATSGAYGDLSGRPALGGAAALNVGTSAGTVAAGNHGHQIGDVTGLQAALTGKVAGIGITAIELITTAAHEALNPPDPTTLYVKSDAPPSIAVVDCGGDATLPRPAGALVVYWRNAPATPVNAVDGDLYFVPEAP